MPSAGLIIESATLRGAFGDRPPWDHGDGDNPDGLVMFRRILVTLDRPAVASKVVERAIELAARSGSSLDLLSVAVEPPSDVPGRMESDAFRQAAREYYEPLQEEALALAQQTRVPANAIVAYGRTVEATLHQIDAQGADLLMIGAAPYPGALLGVTTSQLVVDAAISVLIARPQKPRRTFKELLVCLDGSASSTRALAQAIDLRRAFEGRLRAIVVNGDKDALSSARSAISEYDVRLKLVSPVGTPAAAIAAYAADIAADMIVLGAVGRDHKHPASIGSTAREIARCVGRSVLIAR